MAWYLTKHRYFTIQKKLSDHVALLVGVEVLATVW
jgi:hypothetical protein